MSGSLTRRPLADEVAGAVSRLIVGDGLAPGDVLPPITKLAERLGVSRSVVRDAVAALVDDGVLERASARQWSVRRRPNGSRTKKTTAAGDGSIRHSSLADQAAEAILDLILSEGLREGDPLPSSGDLAERYGVSILVIREALASLAARGVLSRRQGRESVVAVPDYAILSSIMRLRVHLESIEVEELLACRESLESRSAALAADLGEPEDKQAALDVHLAGMRKARSEKEFNDHDLAFHLTVARLSGNRAIGLMLEALNDVVRAFMDVTYFRVLRRDRGLDAAVRGHERIADAIVRGDVEKAAEEMRRHFAANPKR